MIQIDQYEAPPKHYIAGRKEGERLPTAHLSSIDGPNCPRAARLKEVGVIMGGIVLIILVVTLLVILPTLFLLLMLGGLVDGVRRAFFSSGHNKQTPPPV